MWFHQLPSPLFTLRSLRVGYCRLKLPEKISLPAVETLHLTGVHQRSRTIQLPPPRPLFQGAANLRRRQAPPPVLAPVLPQYGERGHRRVPIGNLGLQGRRASGVAHRHAAGFHGDPLFFCTIDLCRMEPSTAEELAGLGNLLNCSLRG